MKKVLVLAYISISFFSCMPDPMGPVIEEPKFNCTIEIRIQFCPTWNCMNPTVYPNKRVEVYESSYAAMEAVNPIFVDSTNQNGWLKFYDLACDKAFVVRVDLGENGVYIGNINFFTPNQKVDVRIIDNLYYDNNAWGQPIVPHVSLEFPVVGQYSTYRFFEQSDVFSFGGNSNYSNNVFLQVYITNQLDENTFIVSENASNLTNTYVPHFGNGANNIYTETVWRIQNDSLFISSRYPDNGIISVIWNITDDEELVNGEYVIPLTNESSNHLEMNGDFELPVSDWIGIASCSDFQSPDYLFQDLLVEKRNFTTDDGPLKYLVFNKRDGIVRSLIYSEDFEKQTAGFDLEIQ